MTMTERDYYDAAESEEKLCRELYEVRAEIERLKAPAMIADMREKMAALCHDQWAGWMEFLFLKSKQVDGCVIIPAWAVDRWRRQVATRYSDLSEDEKNSDRNEADRFLSLFNAEIECKDKLIERLVSEIENKQYTITCADEENQQLKESLAEARAEIERLRQELRDNSTQAARQIVPAEMLVDDLATEIERKDALIEQMKELLKKSLRVFSTSYVNAAQMETLHEIAALIK